MIYSTIGSIEIYALFDYFMDLGEKNLTIGIGHKKFKSGLLDIFVLRIAFEHRSQAFRYIIEI